MSVAMGIVVDELTGLKPVEIFHAKRPSPYIGIQRIPIILAIGILVLPVPPFVYMKIIRELEK
jgi:hypothetical protein